ncbi:hypothetical protein O7635_07315 [Asanoa sp. WMMD1127]|uniref:hypothetical protein n=1 Tax=Asanoa sp. WMMD1127 TaxID=3016107 RepID=UPI00241701BA|nr:hypothetical protein [Asanoa sp. WMMD1127]MDG4821660.1 hypothetical protein [Asanoa sp. WMMD1127]
MVVRRGLALLSIGVLTAAGLAVGVAAAAEPPATIHVANSCGSTQDGSKSRPYCTISKAAEVALPGQTIAVDKGRYAETVVVPSGQPGKPITFAAYRGPGGRVELDPGPTGTAFRASGVHDVVIDGFELGYGTAAPVLVENSSDITVSNGWLTTVDVPGVDVRGGSQRVTVSGMSVWAVRAPAFAIGAGATGTVLAGNSVRLVRSVGPAVHQAVTVADAPATTITNNTIVTDCGTGVAVSGASAGFALHNSIVRTVAVGLSGRCAAASGPDPASVLPVTVAGAATADGRVDYNVIDPGHGGALYSWGDTAYPSLTAFRDATGQGTHDIAADPKLVNADSYDAGWSLTPESPAIDSALADAPARPATDLVGNARADKPDSPNSGGGFVDRGAVELVPAASLTSTISRVPGGSAFETVTTAKASYAWVTDGPIGVFTFNRNVGRPIVNRTGTARVTFTKAGWACVMIEFSPDGFRSAKEPQYQSPCMMLGGSYTAVAPQRVLDTRTATGVSGTRPVNSNEEIQFALPAPAANASAVVLNVTVTKPTGFGAVKVYEAGDTEPNGNSIMFATNQTIANLVTVRVRNGRVALANKSYGTVHVLADLAGYYADGTTGLRTATPVRVLDTRTATGVPGTAPIGPQGKVTVDVSSRVPAGTAAVVLSLTATKPTQSGHFTAYPPGAAVPAASNINFVANQTVNNMVIAPVVNGKIAFAHGGSGTVHLIADLSGWFAPGGGDMYLPTYPSHLLEPGFNAGATVGPGKSVRVFVSDNECGSTPCEPRAAVVVNVAVTSPQSGGYLSVYPYGQARPAASVLNFGAGQNLATLVTVGLGEDSFMVYNSSSGTVQVWVDQAGFYLGPVT